MIKKSLTSVAAVFMVCVMLFSLVGCKTVLKGTYTSKEGLIKQSFTFKEDNKVEVSAFGIDVEGEYVIEDGKITITYSLLNLSYDMEKSFEKKGSSIFIDGVEFVKEK